MRDVERRTIISRRSVLHGTAAIAAAGVAISPTASWAQEAKALSPRSMATLVRMARDIYPHDHIGDVFYVRAVTPWDAKAGSDAPTKALIEDGVGMLDGASRARFATGYIETPWEEQRVEILRGMEGSAFFQKIRGDLVVSLYNQHDLWAKFGYEGSSADKGGYIHRGFNDIDWLPQV